MKSFFTLVVAAFMLQFGNAQAPETSNPEDGMTSYFFIRHAEKDTSDPQNRDPKLSPEGEARAQRWAEIFRETSFDLIYSTDYNRTRKTANTIAGTKGLEVEFYDPKQMNDEEFQKKTKGKTLLVVGHSNTNPHFVNSILKEAKYQDIDEAESGSLFIVTVSPAGEKTCQVLYIN